MHDRREQRKRMRERKRFTRRRSIRKDSGLALPKVITPEYIYDTYFAFLALGFGSGGDAYCTAIILHRMLHSMSIYKRKEIGNTNLYFIK